MEITNILIAQIEILKELHSTLLLEKEILINEEAIQLKTIIENKQILLEKLNDIEAKRNMLCGNKTLNEIIEESYNEDELINIKETLKNLTSNITELSETNRLLTKQSLNYSKNIVKILTDSAKKQNSTYGQYGNVKENNIGSSIINKKL